MNIIELNVVNLNHLEIGNMIDSKKLSAQVISQSEQYNDVRKKQFIAGRFLLSVLIEKFYKIKRLPEIEIINNKPSFINKSLPNFNISHSGEYVAVAISANSKIGLDIEQNRPRKNLNLIADQFFTQCENEWICSQKDKTVSFWYLWTLREAALKLYAKGVWQMKSLKIKMPEVKITSSFAQEFYTFHQKEKNFFISICSNKKIDKINFKAFN